jgi:hypothetical protein
VLVVSVLWVVCVVMASVSLVPVGCLFLLLGAASTHDQRGESQAGKDATENAADEGGPFERAREAWRQPSLNDRRPALMRRKEAGRGAGTRPG